LWLNEIITPSAQYGQFNNIKKGEKQTMSNQNHIYMVDRDLPGITLEQLAGAQQAAIATSEQFAAAGKSVRYIRSMFVPGESHCMCLFEAPEAGLVKEVNEAAQLPYTRIVEAMDLPRP
jgi:hypothetical protein